MMLHAAAESEQSTLQRGVRVTNSEAPVPRIRLPGAECLNRAQSLGTLNLNISCIPGHAVRYNALQYTSS